MCVLTVRQFAPMLAIRGSPRGKVLEVYVSQGRVYVSQG